MNLTPPRLADSFTYSDARLAGWSDRSLRHFVAAGSIERIGRGVYRRAGAPPIDEDLHEIAARAPDATLCLATALARHGLTDEMPGRIDVALPRARRPPRLRAIVTWHRFAAATYELGRELLKLGDGLTIGLYGPERCIVDAFRLRHIGGADLAIEALRRWLRRPGSAPTSLLLLGHAFPKAEPALRAALTILA